VWAVCRLFARSRELLPYGSIGSTLLREDWFVSSLRLETGCGGSAWHLGRYLNPQQSVDRGHRVYVESGRVVKERKQSTLGELSPGAVGWAVGC
jgi:hypothetical protein